MATAPGIDWDTAQRVGELIAGSPTTGAVAARSAQELAHDFARRVGDHTGLELPEELPPLEMIDRSDWIAANLLTMRPLLDPLAQRLTGGDGDDGRRDDGGRDGRGAGTRSGGLLGGPLRAAPGHLLGAQLGAVTGLLSQRVLGQYDVSLLDPDVAPRLLLLAPNLAGAARNLEVDRDELVAWVAIHEITHAVQFSGAPWLRGHLGGLLGELLESMPANLELGGLKLGDPLRLIELARRGELLRLGVGERRWELVQRMQATMSLIEGHAEHTMDAVGAEVLPSLPRLRAALTRRRESRGLPWRVLERILGLELKMRQYEVGRRFCDAVVDTGGPQLLALAWRSPEDLPSAAELADPRRWSERMRVAA